MLLVLLCSLVCFDLICKMLTNVCHKSCGSGTELGVVFKQEVVGFKCEITLIVYVRQRVADRIPVDFRTSWESMKVMNVVNVVNVETTETVVSDGSDSILRLSAAESYVTEVETNRECLGIV